MRHLRNVGLAVLLLVLSASTAFAQRRVNTGGAGFSPFWEFGVDFASIVFGMDNPSTTSLGFGSGSIRAGRYISDIMSIEPVLGFGTFSTSGLSSNNLYIEVGVLYHLQAERTKGQWYVRPNLIFTRSSSTSGGTTNSTNRMGLGAGFGMKRPSKKNARFTWRAEATYTNMMKSGSIPSSSQLAISGGASVFTK